MTEYISVAKVKGGVEVKVTLVEGRTAAKGMVRTPSGGHIKASVVDARKQAQSFMDQIKEAVQ